MSPRKRVPLLSCAPVLMAGMLEKKRRSGARAGSYQPGFYILNEMNQLERQRLSPRGVVTQANFEIEDEPTPLGPLSLQVRLRPASSSWIADGGSSASSQGKAGLTEGKVELKASSRAERDDWMRAINAAMTSVPRTQLELMSTHAADREITVATAVPCSHCTALRVAYCKRSKRVVATHSAIGSGDISGVLFQAEYEDSICFVLDDGTTAELRCSAIRAHALAASTTGQQPPPPPKQLKLVLEPKSSRHVLCAELVVNCAAASSAPTSPTTRSGAAAKSSQRRSSRLRIGSEALAVASATAAVVGRFYLAPLSTKLGSAAAICACALGAVLSSTIYLTRRGIFCLAAWGIVGAFAAETMGLSIVPHAMRPQLTIFALAVGTALTECVRAVASVLKEETAVDGVLMPLLGLLITVVLAAMGWRCCGGRSRRLMRERKRSAAAKAVAVVPSAPEQTKWTLRGIVCEEVETASVEAGDAASEEEGAASLIDDLLDTACTVPPGFTDDLSYEGTPFNAREAAIAREVLNDYFSTEPVSPLDRFNSDHGTKLVTTLDPPFTKAHRQKSTELIARGLLGDGFIVAREEARALRDGIAVALAPRSTVLNAKLVTVFVKGWDPTSSPSTEEEYRSLDPKKRILWVQNVSDALRREMNYRTEYDFSTFLSRVIGPPDDLFEKVQACWTGRVYGEDREGHVVFCERACDIDLNGLLAIEAQWPGSVVKARAQFMEACYHVREKKSHERKVVRFRNVLIMDLKGLEVRTLMKAQIRDLITACMNLGHHYPSSLHKQYIVNTPYLFRVAYVVVSCSLFFQNTTTLSLSLKKNLTVPLPPPPA